MVIFLDTCGPQEMGSDKKSLTVSTIFFSTMSALRSLNQNTNDPPYYSLLLWYETMRESVHEFQRCINLSREEALYVREFILENALEPKELREIKLNEFERRLDRDPSDLIAMLRTLQPEEMEFFFAHSTK